jgi:hypothetical protein
MLIHMNETNVFISTHVSLFDLLINLLCNYNGKFMWRMLLEWAIWMAHVRNSISACTHECFRVTSPVSLKLTSTGVPANARNFFNVSKNSILILILFPPFCKSRTLTLIFYECILSKLNGIGFIFSKVTSICGSVKTMRTYLVSPIVVWSLNNLFLNPWSLQLIYICNEPY